MKFFCFHRKLKRVRAHKTSPYGLKNKKLAITVDKFDCLIFLECEDCKKIIHVQMDDNVFDKQDGEQNRTKLAFFENILDGRVNFP